MKRLLIVMLLAVSTAAFGALLESQMRSEFRAEHRVGTAIDSPVYDDAHRYSFGTATGQADLIYHGSFAIASGAALTLTLNDGSLTDSFGAPASFARVIGLSIVSDGSTTLTVGGTFNGWGGLAVLPADASMMLMHPTGSGWATSAASATITITNDSTGTGTVMLWLLGKSA